MGTIVGARGYGIELRERIVKAVQEGKHRDEVAKQFSVHRQTVDLYVIKSELGTLNKTRKPTGRPRLLVSEYEDQILKQVKEFPDATLEEHAQMLLDAVGFKTSTATISRLFARHDITLKKKQSLPVSKTRRPEQYF